MKQIARLVTKITNIDWRFYIFKKTGYSFFSGETSGKTLEFIGTSGVGKTTLYRECVSKLRDRWFFAYQLDFAKRKVPSNEIDEILMQILIKRIEKIYDSESFCPWHSLLDIKLSVKVMHEAMLLAHSTHPKGFVFDEGLFRHFPDEILKLGNEFPVQLWKNRAFVLLRARAPELALERYKSRFLTPTAKAMSQRSSTDEQILSSIAQDQELFQSIVDRAASFGCPVLVVDAEDPLQDTVKKVLDFESSLSREFGKQEKMEASRQLPA